MTDMSEPTAAAGVQSATHAAIRRTALIDLSHSISAGMTTLPGLPGPTIEPHMTRQQSASHYSAGTSFQIDRISLVGNTGTYLDSPLHRYDGARDLARLPLESLADLPAVVVHLPAGRERGVSAEMLASYDVRGAAVLLHTGDAERFGSPDYVEDPTFLTRAAAEWLVDNGAALVGIDAANIDDMSDGERPAHSLLLAAEIPIVEHLTGLEALPTTGARFSAVPPRLVNVCTFPVRAFAIVPVTQSA